MSQLITRFQQLIGAPSISSALPEYDSSNKAVIDLLAEWLTPLGFDCEIMKVPTQETAWFRVKPTNATPLPIL